MHYPSAFLWIALQASAATPDTYSRCENPAADDARPYILCVTETDFDRADVRLKAQWHRSLDYIGRSRGAKARKHLIADQRKWLRKRDRACDAVAASSPSTQSGRNQMSCLVQKTKARISKLKAMMH
ncbi:lysozyme inhibitor LprI family protein [Sphingomonas flavescens]|uniref:lysozyme inhibitor LprI family protein n=1 Tax=Sphingomonas flavescens TaxID=3132797 RepID=UPI003B2118E8